MSSHQASRVPIWRGWGGGRRDGRRDRGGLRRLTHKTIATPFYFTPRQDVICGHFLSGKGGLANE